MFKKKRIKKQYLKEIYEINNTCCNPPKIQELKHFILKSQAKRQYAPEADVNLQSLCIILCFKILASFTWCLYTLSDP